MSSVRNFTHSRYIDNLFGLHSNLVVQDHSCQYEARFQYHDVRFVVAIHETGFGEPKVYRGWGDVGEFLYTAK